jgi:ribosome recycling factor
VQHAIVTDLLEKMEKTIEAFSSELTTVRTGRASTGLLEGIDVDAYGAKMKIVQLGTISAPEARMLTVQPFDKSTISAIEKAIITSPLELTPSNDGHIIRVPMPSLTEERRKDLVKLVHKYAEECRVSIRSARRQAMEDVKQQQKDGDIPEDDAHRLTAEIQKHVDQYVEKIDDMLKHKEEEIMEV